MSSNFADSQSSVFFSANADDYGRVNKAWGSQSYLQKIISKLGLSIVPITPVTPPSAWKW
ncbi:MAG: hypothetical protein K2Y14_08665 [Burkholderiales bacterium]|nr:hypothetical protein [Burkholderiales bacterium]